MSPRPDNRFRDAFQAGSVAPLILAHRGDSYHAPENTLEAARLGFDAGADAWELDVQLAADGLPVVLHDATLTRTTDVASAFADDPRSRLGYLAADFSSQEIARLDAGSWFIAANGGDRSAAGFGTRDRIADDLSASCRAGLVRVPTLVDALDLTARLDGMVNVELKAGFGARGGGELVDAVLAAILETQTADRVLVSSFDHSLVAQVARTAKGVATAILVATPLVDASRYVREVVGADAYHIAAAAVGAASPAYLREPRSENLAVAEIQKCRRDDVPVLVYTVNDALPNGLAEHLASVGVAGLFSDDPRSMARRFRPC